MQTLRLIKAFSFLLLFCVVEALAKPGAAISLRSPSSYQLEPYSNTQLALEFSLPGNATRLDIQIQTTGSVVVLKPEMNLTIDLRARQSSLTLPLEIESREVSANYLMFILILTYENGLTEARSLGIRLQVGEAEAQEKIEKPANNNADKVKVFPAKETVIN